MRVERKGVGVCQLRAFVRVSVTPKPQREVEAKETKKRNPTLKKNPTHFFFQGSRVLGVPLQKCTQLWREKKSETSLVGD